MALINRAFCESVAVRDAMLNRGMAEDWAESLERLEMHLAKA
jgi:hypothetical protein